MNILVIGCGKVGARLATNLAQEGHDVSVIDHNEQAFDVLDPDDNIFTTTGVPIDQDVLRRAGIENCDVVAAVSNDDNINIMVSQLAREIFAVEKVITRIYDPKREAVFSHFGLQTICSTTQTVSYIESALENKPVRLVHLGSHTLKYIMVDVPTHLIGEYAHNLDFDDDKALHAVVRDEIELILYKGQKLILNDTDKLVIAQVID